MPSAFLCFCSSTFSVFDELKIRRLASLIKKINNSRKFPKHTCSIAMLCDVARFKI